MNATGSASNATGILLSLGMTTEQGLSGLGGESGGSDFSSMLSQLLPDAPGGGNALLLPEMDGIQTLPLGQQTLPLAVPPDTASADVNELLGQIGFTIEVRAATDTASANAMPLTSLLSERVQVQDMRPLDEDDDAALTGTDSGNDTPVAVLAPLMPPPPAEPQAVRDLRQQQAGVSVTAHSTPAKATNSRPLVTEAAQAGGDEALIDEEGGFLLPVEERPLQQGSQLSAQQGSAGIQGMTTSPQGGTNAQLPPALAATVAATVDDGSSDSSFVTESTDTQTDTELQAQRLQVARDKLEFGQDRREWGGALGARIMTMVAEEVQQARIQLDPPELGSLEIKLHVSQDQASVQVQAQHAHVREVLEANAHRLRDALAAQGIVLDGFDVSERGQGGADSGQSGDGADAQGGDDWLADDALTEDRPQPQVSSNNLLDTFA